MNAQQRRNKQVPVVVCDGAQLYRQGRWWLPGEQLSVSRIDAAKLIGRDVARPA